MKKHEQAHSIVWQAAETQGNELDQTILQVRGYCKECKRFLHAKEVAAHLDLETR